MEIPRRDAWLRRRELRLPRLLRDVGPEPRTQASARWKFLGQRVNPKTPRNLGPEPRTHETGTKEPGARARSGLDPSGPWVRSRGPTRRGLRSPGPLRKRESCEVGNTICEVGNFSAGGCSRLRQGENREVNPGWHLCFLCVLLVFIYSERENHENREQDHRRQERLRGGKTASCSQRLRSRNTHNIEGVCFGRDACRGMGC